jgi:hypothetical protein
MRALFFDFTPRTSPTLIARVPGVMGWCQSVCARQGYRLKARPCSLKVFKLNTQGSEVARLGFLDTQPNGIFWRIVEVLHDSFRGTARVLITRGGTSL